MSIATRGPILKWRPRAPLADAAAIRRGVCRAGGLAVLRLADRRFRWRCFWGVLGAVAVAGNRVHADAHGSNRHGPQSSQPACSP